MQVRQRDEEDDRADGDREHRAVGGGRERKAVDWLGGARRRWRSVRRGAATADAAQIPRERAPPRCHLPNAHDAVVAAGRKPLAARVHAQRAHAARVGGVARAEPLGVRLELREVGELRQQRFGRNVQLGALRARAEIEVKASLKALHRKVRVRGNAPERIILARHKVGRAVLAIRREPLRLLLRREQVLRGRVVRLGVGGRRLLGRVEPLVHEAPLLAREVLERLVPDGVVVVGTLPLLGRRLRRLRLCVRFGAHRANEPHDALALPHGRHEAALGLGARPERLLLRHGAYPLDGVRVGVKVGVGVLIPLYPADHAHVVVRQLDELAVQGVVHRARVALVVTLDERIELVKLRRAGEALSIQPVPDVVVLIVPLEWHVADHVAHAVVLRVALVGGAYGAWLGCPARGGASGLGLAGKLGHGAILLGDVAPPLPAARLRRHAARVCRQWPRVDHPPWEPVDSAGRWRH